MDGYYVEFQHGKALKAAHGWDQLPPRVDLITFDPNRDTTELEKNLKLDGCPPDFHDTVKDLVTRFWDVFCESGLRREIRGFEFELDTGNRKPICVPLPRYGQNEREIMRKLLSKLEDDGIIEDDHGPWGSMIVLAAKPHQVDVHWKDFQWRLCVSYRKLNAITKPFQYPIPRCDDAVEEIDTQARYFISIDLDSGYWQVRASKNARERLAFFTPDGKKTFCRMPMGAVNAMSVFCSMMNIFRGRWHAVAQQRGIRHCNSRTVVDDVLVWGRDPRELTKYFICVLETLMEFRATATSCKQGCGQGNPTPSR